MFILRYLNRHLSLSISGALLGGFLFGLVIEGPSVNLFLTKAITPLTFLMIYPMMVNLNLAALMTLSGNRVQGMALMINFIVIPAIAYSLGIIAFPNQPQLALGLLLVSLLPTSGMTISWTGMAKGNISAAVKMTVIGLLSGSILTPFYVKFLLGTEIPLEIVRVFKQIAYFILLPLIAGVITRFFLVKKIGMERFRTRVAPKFPPFSTLGAVGIVFIAMALKSQQLVNNPVLVITIIGPLLLLYGLNYMVSTVIAKTFFNREDGIALVYGTVLRNLSIALALAMTAFGSSGVEAALLIALGYIIQVQSAAFYVGISHRIFPQPKA